MTSSEISTDVHPLEIVSQRLIQCDGLLKAIDCTFDDKEGCYTASPKILRESLWGIGALIEQARRAFEAHLDAEIAKRRVSSLQPSEIAETTKAA